MNSSANSSRGVIYIACGEIYRKLTVLSISYLRRYGYTGPVRVLTDFPGWNLSPLGCEVVIVETTGGGFNTRHYKTRLNEYAFDTTLFLDADTLPVSSIDDLWGQVRTADLCMTRDLHPNVAHLVSKGRGHKVTWLAGESSPDRRLPEYEYMASLGLMRHTLHNSGVIMFRKSPAIDQLFSTWHEEWKRFRHEDQLALLRAVSQTGCPVHTLDPCWNLRIKGWPSAEKSWPGGARILHLRPENGAIPEALFNQPVLSAAKGESDKSVLWKRAWSALISGAGR